MVRRARTVGGARKRPSFPPVPRQFEKPSNGSRRQGPQGSRGRFPPIRNIPEGARDVAIRQLWPTRGRREHVRRTLSPGGRVGFLSVTLGVWFSGPPPQGAQAGPASVFRPESLLPPPPRFNCLKTDASRFHPLCERTTQVEGVGGLHYRGCRALWNSRLRGRSTSAQPAALVAGRLGQPLQPLECCWDPEVCRRYHRTKRA